MKILSSIFHMRVRIITSESSIRVQIIEKCGLWFLDERASSWKSISTWTPLENSPFFWLKVGLSFATVFSIFTFSIFHFPFHIAFVFLQSRRCALRWISLKFDFEPSISSIDSNSLYFTLSQFSPVSIDFNYFPWMLRKFSFHFP